MPKLQGNEVLADVTDKSVRRLVILSGIIILVKLYNVKLDDLSLLGVKLPAELLDVVGFLLLIYYTYALVVNWLFDMLAFRLWYSERELWSTPFGTRMKLDKGFYAGGIQLLLKLYELENSQKWPSHFGSLSKEDKDMYRDFKTNVELYIARLSAAGTKFHVLSYFAHYYIWVQSLLFPVALGLYCGSLPHKVMIVCVRAVVMAAQLVAPAALRQPRAQQQGV
jgi:hypothetical protein